MEPVKRDRTTDVLRGMTGIGMILVNTRSVGCPAFLNHAGFQGPITFADTIFPCFLFTSGFSRPPREVVPTSALARRAGILFGVGLLVNQLPKLFDPTTFFSLKSLRIPGVLQRASVASLVSSLDPYLPLGVLPAALIATWYGVSKRWAHSPPDPFACPPATAASRVDAAVFGASHLHEPARLFDPEGLLGSVLTAPVSILLGRLFRSAVIATTSYATGLRQVRVTLFPAPDPKSDSAPAQSRGWTPTAVAAGTAIAFAGLSAGVLTYATPYRTPPSKALWTPPFVGQTTAYCIGYWAIADVLVALTRLDILPASVRNLLGALVERVEGLGRMSLEGYVLSSLGQVLLQAGGNDSAWAMAIRAVEKLIPSRLSGVIVSAAFSLAVVEAVRTLEKRRWRIR